MDGPSAELESPAPERTVEGGDGDTPQNGTQQRQLPATTLLAAALMRNSISLEEGFPAVDVDKDGVVSLEDLVQVRSHDTATTLSFSFPLQTTKP